MTSKMKGIVLWTVPFILHYTFICTEKSDEKDGKCEMKRVKLIGILCLACLAMASITAVSATAQSFDPLTLVSSYVSAYRFVFTHPKESWEIISTSDVREANPELEELINTNPDAQATVRVFNIPNTVAAIGKAGIATLNPQNMERNQIISVKVNSLPGEREEPVSEAQKRHGIEISMLTTPLFYSNPINIDPMFIMKTPQDDLVVLGVVKNFSGKNVVINAIPGIELVANNKILANGTTSGFEAPMKLSYYQQKVNSGVYDGLPTQCFIVIVFAPGTYDDTVDISSLNNLECNYSLDYSYLN